MKISKRVSSLVLSLLMLTSTVGVANANDATEQTETPTPIYYDLSKVFNTSIFANENDTVPAGSTWGYNNTGYEGTTLVTHRSGFSVTTKTNAPWWNNYSAKKATKKEDGTSGEELGEITNSFSDNILTFKKDFVNLGIEKYKEVVLDCVASNSDVPFKIGEMSATAKNAYSFESDNASVTFPGSGAVSQSLNFLFVTGRSNGSSWPKVIIEYANGDKDTHQFVVSWADGGSVKDGDSTYWGSNVYNQNGDLTLGTDNKIVSDTNGKSAFRAVSFTTKNKVIKNITVTANKRALVAVTEFPVTATEYKELKGTEIDCAWNAVKEKATFSNMKAIIAYDDEMKICGISADDVIESGATAKISAYRDIISKTKTDPKYIDFEKNTSIFGNEKDSVTKWGYNDGIHTWTNDVESVAEEQSGFSATSNDTWDSYKDKSNGNKVVNSYNSTNGIFTFAKGFVNLGIYSDGSTSYTSTAVTSDIPFNIGTSLSSSSPNAFAFNDKLDAAELSVTFNGNKIPAQSLNLLIARGSALAFQPKMTVKIKYTDGIENTQSVYVYDSSNGSATVDGQKYGGWEVYAQMPDYKLSNGTIMVNNSDGSENMKRSGLRAISIDTNGNAIESVTVNAHNMALVAVTEIYQTYDEFIASAKYNDVKTAWETVQNVPDETNKKVMIDYADELEAMGIPLIAIDSTKDANGNYKIEKAVEDYKKGSITWSYTTSDGTENKVDVTVSVTNTTKEEQSYEIIVASYTSADYKQLSDVNFETISATEDNVSKTVSVSKTDYIKVFVWDSFGSLQPVGEEVTAQ